MERQPSVTDLSPRVHHSLIVIAEPDDILIKGREADDHKCGYKDVPI